MPHRAFVITLYWLLLSLALITSLPNAAFADAWSDAQPLFRSGQHAEAATLFEAAIARDADDGLSWYGLGLALHGMGDLDGAIDADRRATELPHMRPDAFYNLACAYALQGKLDLADGALRGARAAGYVDFDQMKSDPDLAGLRSAGRIGFPKSYEYEVFRAPNRVEIPYLVVLPEGFDAKRTYPALASFAPGGSGPASSDWALREFWKDSTLAAGWIAIHLVAPDQGWMTHPSHHALEDLLDSILERYRIEGNAFHLVGVGEGGRPAATYSGMSGKYFQSLTTVGTYAYARWDDAELREFKQKNVFLVASAGDPYVRTVNQHSAELMRAGGADVHLELVEGDLRVPGSMLEGGLMRFLATQVRSGRS